MYRSCISCLLAGIVGLVGVTGAAGQQECRPALAFKEVHFSEMQPRTLQRKWTAIVSVDASRCVANAQGHFGIVFRRLKEVGPEIDFREQFVWRPPSVTVEVDLSADEAVQTYWIDHVAACPCSR